MEGEKRMILRVCTFTKQGDELSHQLFDTWKEMIVQTRGDQSLEAWVRDCFAWHLPILFIGACGIAVRAIAPHVQDKLSDSAVLVMDEKGEFVIPILSGHAGGANAIARKISARTGARPVITTATDVEGLFSVDVFAVQNGLRIWNREGIRKVSSKLLAGEKGNFPLFHFSNPLISVFQGRRRKFKNGLSQWSYINSFDLLCHFPNRILSILRKGN